ncbi:predicted protein [Thalassiosira pseudonana CCMP1335]|uniref:Helicase ATP-binding domain-containing protein n=1 Tax=Thalassiosira pseudonana TaxID=35128 RepID=B8LCJ4_THAPS|nr:predicted protein [Thalassiosira pseudonana CCMP1335]EED86909.1 predicted protein [Thalassiosira pseudonana CCMP1335]
MQEGGEQGIGMLFAMLRYDELTTPLVQRSTSGAWAHFNVGKRATFRRSVGYSFPALVSRRQSASATSCVYPIGINPRNIDITLSNGLHLSRSLNLFDEINANDIQDLPIYNILDSIRSSVNEKPNLLLEAAPGAGKTTVVPLLVSSLESVDGKVIVVEPRRVATRSAAQRMSTLINQSPGGSVGYAIRGESKQSVSTRVMVMTDGVLLNMLREDQELNVYTAVILDEFHERGVGFDTALALLREVQMNYRPDLKLIVMSATLLGETNDTGGDELSEESAGAKLLRVLGGQENCNVLRSEGRQYPITIQHSQRSSPLHGSLLNDSKLLIKTMADAIEEGLLKAPNKGDVLAFLPGAKEIRKVVQELESRIRDVDVCPLYGAMPKPDQDRAIYKDDRGRRRIIDSAIQRAGRADQMLIDLEALEQYKVTNTRTRGYKITSHGKQLVRLATHPRFATSIIKAREDRASFVAALTVTALLDEELGGRQIESNLSLCVRDILRAGPDSFIGKQLIKYASKIGDDAKSAVMDAMDGKVNALEVSNSVGRALLPGFIDLIAQYKGDASYGGSSYMLSLGQSARLDGKQNEGDYVIVVDTSSGDDGKTRIRAYSPIDMNELKKVSMEKSEVYAVATKGYEVRARKVTKVGSLVIASSPLPSPSPDEVVDVLLDALSSIGGLPALLPMQSKKDVAEIVSLRNRVALARKHSNEDWPSCFVCLETNDDDIATSLLQPWLAAAGSLKGLDLNTILRSQLSSDQLSKLERDFPTTIVAPDGSSIPITYHSNIPPTASAKLQQFFGATESPCVGAGDAVPLSLELLSPSGKLLATTIDLPFFWRETYPSVRAEMRVSMVCNE